ncbi:MAG: hypothetical protein UZ05_CHB002000250 [Chlorobi bacterium OLB5]|nr:MAG: hypothetical protein UZ05_CHB002000250 [Chlorobi bacterium OLB5]
MENLKQLISIAVYVLFTSGFDSYFYGRGEKGYFKWLFKHFNWFGRDVPMRYRILQKTVELGGLTAVFIFGGFWCVAACLICHYFMLLDRLYYIFNGQEENIKKYEEQNGDPFWLTPFWFSGFFFFKNGFTVAKFNTSALIGIVISLIIIIIS